MKKILIALLIMLSVNKSFSQSAGALVTGSITNTNKIPVESATISLLKSKDSSIVKIDVSDKEGKFSFAEIPYSDYFITVTSVNYNKVNSSKFVVSESNSSIKLDPLILDYETKSLAAVTVVAKKPLIEQKIDRMIVNVDASVTNVGSTALEVLQKSPGVSVDKDGNISLKGKSQVMVMIDGKPSYLGATEFASLLSNMNSNQLSQIEIMTNPSAKYDAAGNAGVHSRHNSLRWI